MNVKKNTPCAICKTLSFSQRELDKGYYMFYACPVCGRYELALSADKDEMNPNYLASFLFHCGFHNEFFETRYYTTRSKKQCDEFRNDPEGNNRHPVHMDSESVANWYPKTFSEKADKIIYYIGTHTKHPGENLVLSFQGLLSLLFIDRYEFPSHPSNNDYKKPSMRSDEDIRNEVNFILKWLHSEALITYLFVSDAESTSDDYIHIILEPAGYSMLSDLQRAGNGINALVAMQFGDETKELREFIRKGIEEAGYHAVFIDEVEHNNFITPEIMKYIKDSRFVVVDLTHQNNGAYFEEGYAMGLGKPVIQLCKDGEKLHFDIAQKNSILWKTMEEIPLRLSNRIKATID